MTNKEIKKELATLRESINVLLENEKYHKTKAWAESAILQKLVINIIESLADKLIESHS